MKEKQNKSQIKNGKKLANILRNGEEENSQNKIKSQPKSTKSENPSKCQAENLTRDSTFVPFGCTFDELEKLYLIRKFYSIKLFAYPEGPRIGYIRIDYEHFYDTIILLCEQGITFSFDWDKFSPLEQRTLKNLITYYRK